MAEIAEASADGTLLRGEVLARWQEFVGTGELLKSLETRVGWLRDRVVNAVKGKPQQAERVTVAVESGLETLILEHAEAAAERAEASWQSVASGQILLADAGEDLGRASRDFRRRAERAVRDWQSDVLEMVRSEGADKRSTARFLAFGVNGLSVALMVVVFAHTAGVTGAEAGIAGGSAVLGQKLLEAVFGDQAVRALAERARRDLESKVSELLGSERQRYLDLLDGLEISPEAPEKLRAASRARRRPPVRRQGWHRQLRSLRRIGCAQHFSVHRLNAVCPRETMTSLLEGAKKLVSRSSEIGTRVQGLEQAVDSAEGRVDSAVIDDAAFCRRPRCRPAEAVGRAHRGRARRRHGLGQVVDVQRAEPSSSCPPSGSAGRRPRGRPRASGVARAPRSSSSGSASPPATR